MKITVTTFNDKVFLLQVSEYLDLKNFKAFCEMETGIPDSEILLFFNGHPLSDEKKALNEFGITDGDCVLLQQQRLQNDRPLSTVNKADNLEHNLEHNLNDHATNNNESATAVGSKEISNDLQMDFFDLNEFNVNFNNNPIEIRNEFLLDPKKFALLEEKHPRLLKALITENFDSFTSLLREEIDAENQRNIKEKIDDSDEQIQTLIAEEIRNKNIQYNLAAAVQFNPEMFGSVIMLFIKCKVNGIPIMACVDSGAQTTTMSAACAERCKVNRLIDLRYPGLAKGTGTQKIIGRIHMVQLQIGNDFLTNSLSILEHQLMDMLLGLDMLKRHQCVIDLQRSVLQIGTTGREATFLSENELPEFARLTQNSSAEIKVLPQLEEDGEAEAIEKKIDPAAPSTGEGQKTENSISSFENFNDNDIEDLVSLCYDREEVITELRSHNGNKTEATAALIAKSLKF